MITGVRGEMLGSLLVFPIFDPNLVAVGRS